MPMPRSLPRRSLIAPRWDRSITGAEHFIKSQNKLGNRGRGRGRGRGRARPNLSTSWLHFKSITLAIKFLAIGAFNKVTNSTIKCLVKNLLAFVLA